MNITSLTELFSEMLGQKVYAINFPEFLKGRFIKLEITTGLQELGGVYDFNVQFMVKAEHPSESEKIALDIIEALDMTTNTDFACGKYQLILMKASSPQPFFEGETTDGDFLFSADFKLLTTRI